MSNFSVQKGEFHSRIGSLKTVVNEMATNIETPILFPVVSLITGSSARGGGLWKYVLHEDKENGLLRRNIPLMTQVLHFLDFRSATPKSMEIWRERSIRNMYNTQVQDLNFTAPIFLDSGGFKLMWGQNIDLSEFGLTIENGLGPSTIYKLQKDLGGNIVASLDYPIPPGLSSKEAKKRMAQSIDNAIESAQLIEESEYKPYLFVAVHGQTKKDIRHYVEKVFKLLEDSELGQVSIGLAIGSLVPLRGAKKNGTIVSLVQGAIEGIPKELKYIVPIHVFGITGNLIPILSYLGVDSFDSSTYAQQARNLRYLAPGTRHSIPILEMEKFNCNCRICSNITLKEIQDGLTSPVRYKPLENGIFKSKYYSDVALHNLEMDFDILSKTKAAIQSNALREFLVEFSLTNKQIQSMIDYLCVEDEKLKNILSRRNIAIGNPSENLEKEVPRISLEYTSKDFDVLRTDYKGPKKGKNILLLVPCSKGKPYSESRTHKFVMKNLENVLGDKIERIHKVTLSGLYGPVPDEFENLPEILGYDFQLQPFDKHQITFLYKRLVSFIDTYKDQYSLVTGYATSRAYRAVLEKIEETNPEFYLFPQKPKSRRMTEFFRMKNFEELANCLLEDVI
ncbi:tRNA-guanine transglycosylase [Chloroflexota bacterium]